MTERIGTRGSFARPLLAVGAAGLLLAVVAASAVFSLSEIEEKALAAAEAEGRALLQAVSTGVERSLQASRAVEMLLARRLLTLAEVMDADLEEVPGRETEVLKAYLLAHALRGAVLLDSSFRILAATDGSVPPPARPGPPSPLDASRLTSMVAEDLVRRARAAGLGERDEAIVGFGENPLGARVEFLVGARLTRTGGWLLLRQDASRLATFRREEGVERLLVDAARTEGISYLLLQSGDGTVLAASDPTRVGQHLDPPRGRSGWRAGPEGRVLDVAVPAEFAGGMLRVGLAAEPVEGVLSRGRRSVLLFSALVLLIGGLGGAALWRMDRARRRREAAFEQERRQREQVAAMGRLAAGVAHEVRSPLNAIGMAAQRLDREVAADEPDAERIREIVGSTRREVTRLNRIVEDFLDLGRTRPLDRKEMDLAALAEEVAAAEDSAARRVGPAPFPVVADREELRKALANLVRNARQAAGEAEVIVEWGPAPVGFLIEVRDAGPGVAPEDRERIFTHFTTRRPGGTGLGLAIARSVAEKHGGSLELNAAPEGGARFVLTLPAGRNP